MLRRKHRLQRLAMHPDFNFGRKEGGLTFGHELVGATTPLTAAAAPADDTLGLLIKTCLGNTYNAAGTAVVAAPAPTTTTFSVTPAQGARLRAGTAILVEGTGTGGVNEVALIKSVATDDVTLEFALSAAPANGAKIWNSYSNFIDASQYKTLQGQLVGEAVADRWFAAGIYGKLTFANLLQLEEVATCQFDLAVTQWDEDIVAAGVVAGIVATALVSSGGALYYLEGTNLHRLILDGITIEDDVIVAEDVGSIGNSLGPWVGVTGFNEPDVYALSLLEDTDLSYPTNSIPEILAYQCAMDYKAKQRAPDNEIAILKMRRDELRVTLAKSAKRDEYNVEKIRNKYSRGYIG
jgi:hypothetical protein